MDRIRIFQLVFKYQISHGTSRIKDRIYIILKMEF